MQPNPEPECVRVKREAQERIDRETASMTEDERDAHIHREATRFAESLGIRTLRRPAAKFLRPRRAARANWGD